MNAWLPLIRAALGLALDEWRDARERRRVQQAHARDPRSRSFVTCTTCGERVRADAESMAAHRHGGGA